MPTDNATKLYNVLVRCVQPDTVLDGWGTVRDMEAARPAYLSPLQYAALLKVLEGRGQLSDGNKVKMN